MVRPVIGITGELEAARWGYWIREAVLSPVAYARAVERAGGAPVVLPPVPPDSIPALVSSIAGLVFTGGKDIDPALYDQERHDKTDLPDHRRDRFELALMRAAIEADLPFLAIGRGLHILNLARGGTIIQHLPDELGHDGHRPDPVKLTGHEVQLSEASKLGKAYGGMAAMSGQVLGGPAIGSAAASDAATSGGPAGSALTGGGALTGGAPAGGAAVAGGLMAGGAAVAGGGTAGHTVIVPAGHHQGLGRLGEGLLAAAWTPADQVIEAVELQGHSFGVAVQWHPEEDDDGRLMATFVVAAQRASAGLPQAASQVGQRGRSEAVAAVPAQPAKKLSRKQKQRTRSR